MKGKTLKSGKKGPAFGAGPTIAEVSGTVDRYLSVAGNVTGSGSITCFISFIRNP